jgi:hypothetical protein
MTAGPDQTRADATADAPVADRAEEANMAEFHRAEFNPAESDVVEGDVIEGDVVESDAAERDVTWLDAARDDRADDLAEDDLPTANPAAPAESAGPAGPALQVVPSGDTQPPPQATADTGMTSTGMTSTGMTGTGINGNDERWHDVVAGFIDDPRGSVAEAADLVEAEVTSLIALLSRRRDTLSETWQTEGSSETGSATEDLRLAMRGYREFSSQLAASMKALS